MKKSDVALLFVLLLTAVPTVCGGKRLKEASTIETVKPQTTISEYNSFEIKFFLRGVKELGGKRVVFFCPDNMPIVGFPKDCPLCKQHDISVVSKGHSGHSIDELKVLKPSFINFSRGLLGDARRTRYAYKAFSLLSDTNETLDIYRLSYYGNDLRFYATPHVNLIALLIDEKDTIVSILSDVRSENDIIAAFAVQ